MTSHEFADRPVSAAVAAIAAAMEEELASPNRPLRLAAWEEFEGEVRRFIAGLSVCASLGLDTVLEHGYREANRSLAGGGNGGPWWAFLVEYGAGTDARRAVAQAEAILEAPDRN